MVKFKVGMKVKNRKNKTGTVWTIDKVDTMQISAHSDDSIVKSILIDFRQFKKTWYVLEQEEL